MHTVRDGDTLPSISYDAYGDATKWRLIAEANGVDNPLHLRRGASLSLPTPGDLMPAAGTQQHVAGDRGPRRRRPMDPKWRELD